MSVAKQSYYPTSYTLNLIDGFGTKPFPKPAKKLIPTQSLSKMPAFACKGKAAFDKQSLLQQIRVEKQKSYFINITNSRLLRNISKKKIKNQRPVSSLLSRQPAGVCNSPLKREIQQLVAQLAQQNQEIRNVKTSKKYNRFIELQILKETYLQEIKQMKYKIKCFKYELKQKKRVKREQKKRAKDIKAMNRAVQQRIDTQNEILVRRLQEVSLRVKQGVVKQIAYRKDRERLLAEIYQLQRKTAIVYIPEDIQADYSQQNGTLRNEEHRDNGVTELSNEDSQDFEEESAQSQFSSDVEQIQIKQGKEFGERGGRKFSF